MEKLKNITVIFLLAVGLLTSVAPAKTTSVLLQEGLYAEEIQGDLDAAIKIYEQVISESKEIQRAAAQATYRIGMCFLKKGEKSKAAERFRNLISKYPEHKTLMARAREQLKKLGPAFMGNIGSAEHVPVDQLIKSGKVPSFKTQVYDNTGLDLETGLSMAFIGEWPTLYDVAWDNDGGGALMIKPRSSVRFLALGAAEKWEDAISMARNSLDVLRTSTSKGMFASQSKYAAVLTCEGNLAVIQIGEYDANKGTIYVWLEYIHIRGFGPVMEQVINDDGEEKNWLIDFDTGRLFSHSIEIRSEEAILRWIAENRIDAMGDTGTSSPGLYGFDMAVIPIAAEKWYSISPEELVDYLSIAKRGTPAFMSSVGKLPVTYIFKTREGGMGIVQILEMQHNKKPRYFRIRYKMLQVETAPFRVQSHIVFLPECDTTVYDLLDLANNSIINSEPGGELIDLSDPNGKGNLYFDRSSGSDYLACVRGTRMQLRSGGKLLSSEPNFISHGISAYYPLVEIPSQYLVTTAQGDKYELKVLSVMSSDKPSIEIEYWKSAEATLAMLPEKVRPSARSFGPVMERVINDNGEEKHWLIDFETGRLFSPSTETHSEEVFSRWIAENRIDAMGETRTSSPGLYGFGMEAIPIAAETWDTISPKGLADALSIAKSGIRTVMSAKGNLPLTYTFKTREGGMGVIQILEMHYKTKPRYFRIRYKMLRPAAMKETVKLNVGKPAYEWWTSEPSVTKTMYEGSELEICWETDPKISERILGFAVGIMPHETDLTDLDEHMWFVHNLAFTVRRTPYGKRWSRSVGLTMDPKRLQSGQYRVYVCAFDKKENIIWRDMLRRNLVGSGMAKLIVKPITETRTAFLPDADDVIQQGKVAVVLDLTTGKMLPGNKDKQYFNKLNKGDVAYFDDEGKDLLVCFRGAKITRKTADEKYSDTPDQSHTDNTIHLYIIKNTPAEWTITTKEGDIYELKVLSLDNNQAKIKYRKMSTDVKVWTIKPDLSSPEATIKSFVKAVYDGNLEAAGACVSKDGADYDEFKEMLATESNHPFQAMIKAMDVSIPVEITSKDITEDRCKIKWYFTLGRVYYIGDTKIKKGTHQEFSSYLELVGDKWLIRDI